MILKPKYYKEFGWLRWCGVGYKGFMQAYIDFFYLTNGTTPSSIEPSDKLIEEQKLNKQVKTVLD